MDRQQWKSNNRIRWPQVAKVIEGMSGGQELLALRLHNLDDRQARNKIIAAALQLSETFFETVKLSDNVVELVWITLNPYGYDSDLPENMCSICKGTFNETTTFQSGKCQSCFLEHVCRYCMLKDKQERWQLSATNDNICLLCAYEKDEEEDEGKRNDDEGLQGSSWPLHRKQLVKCLKMLDRQEK